MDIPTQLAIKHANINQLSKLVEADDHEISMARGELEAVADKALKLSSMLQDKSDDDQLEAWVQSKITKAKDYINSVVDYMTYNPDFATEHMIEAFSDQQIAKLKKEYEPLRGARISVTNANKLGAMFTKFDSNKNALEKLYGGNIPFISQMAMARLISKHGYTADKIKKIKVAEEVEVLEEGTGTIKGFRNDKEKSNMISLAKQHSLKVKEVSGGIELSGNMRKILDMQLAAQGNGLKAEEYINEGRMSEIDAMRKAGATAADIAKELKLSVKVVKSILGEQLTEEEDAEKLKSELEDKEKVIAQLKQKAETDKAKVAKKETEKLVNPETGEPLLQVGVAYKHLKDKMAKEKASEAELEKAKEDQKKKDVSKFKDIARKVMKKKGMMEELSESDASDKAKSMGLDYMKFGRYGKDGKVTHKSIGGNLTKVDKDEKPVDEPDTPKDEPKKDEPKKPEVPYGLDPQKMQNDLEDMVTDGMIDVEFDDADGSIIMNKEYEPSQDYDAEKDMEAIIDYLEKKGVNPDDASIGIDGGEDDGYLSLSVMVTPKGSNTFKKEEVSEGGPGSGPQKGGAKKSNFTSAQIKQAYGILNDPRYKQGNYSGAVKTINKVSPGLADHPDVKNALKRANESLDEMAKDKAYAIGMSTAKKKYNDEPPLEKKTIKKGHEIADKLLGMKKEETIKEFKKMTVSFKSMDQMSKASTDLAKHGFTISGTMKALKVDGKGADLNKYATDLKNFYGATVKAEENAMSLTDLERMKKTGLKTKKEETKHDLAKMKFEQIAGLKKKAEKSGMPYGILKKVYDRGMAAWRGGHRPGASQQQWAFARVNSFVTKSSGTWGGADKDLAAKVKGE